MNPTMTIAPHEEIADGSSIESLDERFWWESIAPSLNHLLQWSQYTIDERASLLDWFKSFILPSLGPRPIPGQRANFEPCLVHDGSICELSVNWKERDPRRTVRFTIEARDHQAGTPADPFNQATTHRLLHGMARRIPSIDLTQFDQLAKEFFLPAEALHELKPRLPADAHLSQVWTAFDLLGDQVVAKVYFFPILKSILTGIPTRDLVRTANTHIATRFGDYNAAFAVLDDYLDSFSPSEAPHVQMVAIDCIDSPTARHKVYLKTTIDTLAKAKDAFTMGERLQGTEIDSGIEALGHFWRTLFGLENCDDFDNAQVLPKGAGCVVGVEMKVGAAVPDVKLYCPVRKLRDNDGQICASLADFINQRGDAGFAESYTRELEQAL